MTDQYITALLVVGLLALLAGIPFEIWRARHDERPWFARRRNGASATANLVKFRKPGRRSLADPVEQLRVVMAADFEKCRLLSRAEASVLYAAEKAIREAQLNWRVMAQVSLGEILSSPDARAYRAINSKRVDILIVSGSGIPIAAIEYQGSGHYQGAAAARDAVKKEALRKAGIRYLEIMPDQDADEMARQLVRVASNDPPILAEARPVAFTAKGPLTLVK